MVTQTFTATDQGFYDSTGFHEPSVRDYEAGPSPFVVFRNFFAFDLTGAFEVVSASFTVATAFYNSVDTSEIWRMFDVSTDVTSLVAGGEGLTATFDDLGSGASLGETTLSLNNEGQFVTITLNLNGITALNAAMGGLFAIGGAVATIGPANPQSVFAFSGSQFSTLQLETTGAVDLAETTATLGTIGFGATVEGHVGTFLDRDWFAATLIAGENYLISLNSLVPGSVDPFLILRDAVGVELARSDDADFELNSLIAFRATTTGTHFIDAGLAEFLSLGGYVVTLTDAISAGIDSTATVAVNRAATDVPLNGVIGGIGDVDAYAVEFRRGDTYQIRLTGDGTAGQVSDTIVSLLDNTGFTLATNDDFLDSSIGVRSSTLFVTANETATFFITADGFGAGLGGYRLSVFTDLVGHVTNADSLFGGSGGDVIQGLGGNDTLDGGKGADTVLGGANNDTVVGGRGDDDLSGGRGNVSLDGGRHDDRLTGGDGDDTLVGGDGRDVFVYLDRNEGSDRISGFTFDVDRIDLSAAGVTGLGQLTVTFDGGDTLIDFGRTTIRLEGFTASLLEEDFIFA